MTPCAAVPALVHLHGPCGCFHGGGEPPSFPPLPRPRLAGDHVAPAETMPR